MKNTIKTLALITVTVAAVKAFERVNGVYKEDFKIILPPRYLQTLQQSDLEKFANKEDFQLY